MKKLKWTVLPIVALLSLSLPALGAGLNMHPGLWRVETKTTIKGLPFPMSPKTFSMDECVTSEHIKNPWKNMQKNKNCHYTDLQVSGNSAKWKIKCGGEQPMLGEGAIIMDSPTRYHGYSDMKVQGGDMPMKTHAEYKGHRIGSCPNGS